jgi:uncharacterized protein (TIGR03067 family)
VVLCELEGHGRKEAALQLGVPEGTLSSRLAHARRVLARRLRSRGVTLAAGGVTTLLTEHAATAAVSTSLLASTVQAASATQAAPAAVASLAKGVLTAMFLGKLQRIAVGVLLGAAALGLGLGTRDLWAEQETAAQAPRADGADAQAEPPSLPPQAAAKKEAAAPAENSVYGLWRIVRIDSKEETRVFQDPSARMFLRLTATQAAFSSNARFGFPVSTGPGESIGISNNPDLYRSGGSGNVSGFKADAETFDWTWLGYNPQKVSLGKYALEGNRLRLYFGEKGGARPKDPTDAWQTWTLVRPASRQEVYQKVDALQGRWKAVAGEYNGAAFAPRELATVHLTIEGDCWEISRPAELGQPDAVPPVFFESRFKFVVDSVGTQNALVLSVDVQTAAKLVVLYELRGDELKVCWNSSPRPHRPPKELKTTPDSDLVLFVLKRERAGPVAAPGDPGAAVGAPNRAAPEAIAKSGKTQFRIGGPEGMKVRVFDAKEDKSVPARFTFDKPGTYRLRMSNVTKRPGQVYYPTLEILPLSSPQDLAFVANSYIPVELEDEDFRQADAGIVVTRYYYLDPDGADRAQVSDMRPGGTEGRGILAILRLGGIDLENED